MSIGINLRDEDRNHPEDDHAYKWDGPLDPDNLPDHWTQKDDYEYQSSDLVRVDQVKFGVRKSILDHKGWYPTFTIGVQTFKLAEVESEELAKWYVDMMKIAFNKLTIS